MAAHALLLPLQMLLASVSYWVGAAAAAAVAAIVAAVAAVVAAAEGGLLPRHGLLLGSCWCCSA